MLSIYRPAQRLLANPEKGPADMDHKIREKLLHINSRLLELGLNRGSSGNCSVRLPAGDGFLVTPSGIPTDRMSVENLVKMTFSGQVIREGKPSSEWRFHRDILQNRPEINAVIHTHSTHATTLACLRRDLPPFHYMIAVAGGDSIRCAPYALFGSQALSDAALSALEDRKACLLGNHGVIAIGENLDEALDVAIEVENLCEQYLNTLKVGEPHLLSKQEMAEVMEQFKGYGHRATEDGGNE